MDWYVVVLVIAILLTCVGLTMLFVRRRADSSPSGRLPDPAPDRASFITPETAHTEDTLFIGGTSAFLHSPPPDFSQPVASDMSPPSGGDYASSIDHGSPGGASDFSASDSGVSSGGSDFSGGGDFGGGGGGGDWS
jgi:uncharacterized membrane protein YgcG